MAQTDEPEEIDTFLDEALDGGPVICDPYCLRCYALVHDRMPTTWRAAADDWQTQDVDCLGHGTYLGVPRPDVVDAPDHRPASYWAVPLRSPAALCAPLRVARLIAAGAHRVTEESEEPQPHIEIL